MKALTSKPSSSPVFRGCVKWSTILLLYSGMEAIQDVPGELVRAGSLEQDRDRNLHVHRPLQGGSNFHGHDGVELEIGQRLFPVDARGRDPQRPAHERLDIRGEELQVLRRLGR